MSLSFGKQVLTLQTRCTRVVITPLSTSERAAQSARKPEHLRLKTLPCFTTGMLQEVQLKEFR